MENGGAPREDRWSEALAVGSLAFVERVKNDLGVKAAHRKVLAADRTYALREPSEAYTRNLTGENKALSSENTLPWNESLENPVDSVVRPTKHVKEQPTPYLKKRS